MTPELILGAGEVGRALHEVTSWNVRDLDPVEEDGPRDVLHIAYPWWDGFVEATKAYQQEYRAPLVVVHSTVPPGTCDPHGWVHSPVRGRHPNLAESLRTFLKLFGGARAEEAAWPWIDLGLPAVTTSRAVTTELGKVWELAQFGVAVALEKLIYEDSTRLGADYEVVYRVMASSYNEGYAALGEAQFLRPVLTHHDGPIGGHCVVPAVDHLDHDAVAELVRGAGR